MSGNSCHYPNSNHVIETALYSQTKKLTTLSVRITVFNASVYRNKSKGLRCFSHVIRVNNVTTHVYNISD